jgi:RimJ/RimL family protein N-acetyltransferase
LWAQHPDPDRWQRRQFVHLIDGGLLSGLGCHSILENLSQRVVGSTRFDGPDAETASIRTGFTFLARSLWGMGASPEINGALLALSFKHFDTFFLILAQRTVDQLPQ